MITVSLQIRDSAREPVQAMLRVEEIPVPERIGRAAGIWLGAWVVAVGCVFLPLLHFVLVPAFFIAGPVAAWLVARKTVQVKSATITCPRCGKETPIEAGTTGWPATLRCALCSTTFFARP